jgi:hypothetical protein
MTIDWQRIAPVIVSIIVIIAVAVLRNYSKTFAAIAATMPINVPLALWIVFAGDDDLTIRTTFTEGMLIGIFPTAVFLAVAWIVVRAGWSLIPVLIVGYIAWGVSLAALLLLRRMI